MYCMALKVYINLWGSDQGTKNVFKHILQTFATKWTFPSLTVILIPISTHPTSVQGPHPRTPNPGFNPLFTPRICYIKEGVNHGLNPGFGVLRFGLSTVLQCFQTSKEKNFTKLLLLGKLYFETHIFMIYSIQVLLLCLRLRGEENFATPNFAAPT
jgi:hypothetical protein